MNIALLCSSTVRKRTLSPVSSTVRKRTLSPVRLVLEDSSKHRFMLFVVVSLQLGSILRYETKKYWKLPFIQWNNGHVVGSDFECEMEEHLSIHEDRIY